MVMSGSGVMIFTKWIIIRKVPKKILKARNLEITKSYVVAPGIQMLINAVHRIAIMKCQVTRIYALVTIFMASVV